ncbi:exonuclease domain-containing protein [Mangrovicoccus algicola]|uniref:DNA-directed DNA polymerase n=1 Tax=Mangrovicoccus algicola TaxID=2771008 RepID=A0A8J6YPM6_9RHOB|nr:exonuclease domain-containing protein [Mangrovicoccus algicola]MBE3637128.1 DNA polymerase III subunit epsilon [Mangrovicoccus algicola]
MSAGPSLRQRILLVFAAACLGGLAILAGSGALALARGGSPAQVLLTAAIPAGFGLLGLAVLLWRLADERLARPADRLAAALRARAHGGPQAPLDPARARDLGDLAPAAAALAEQLNEARDGVARAVETRTEALSLKAGTLAALVSDVPVGLIVAGPAHQIVFYNTPARRMLSGTGQPRLGRPVFDLLRESPIRRAYDRLRATGTHDDDDDLLVSTTGDGRALAAHIRLIRRDLGMTHDQPGYVLTLRDVTAELAVHRDRDRLLRDMADRLGAPAAALRSQIGAAPVPSLPPGLVAAAQDMEDAIDAAIRDCDGAWRGSWPLRDIRAAELADGLVALLGADGPAVTADPPALLLRCDGGALAELLAALAREAEDRAAARDLRLEIAGTGAGAEIRLGWTGAAMAPRLLQAVLDRPLEAAAGAFSAREILERHATAISCGQDGGGRAWLSLPLASARPLPAPPAPQTAIPARDAVYDFDLLAQGDHADIDATPLSRLTCVIFDTETTGLAPHGGDEIVQIAALRVVNGRLVPGEEIDQLVDPGRPIPPGATRIHGITDAMVAGAPGIAEAGAQLHRFARRAVLVAHNAPFDMAFLHRHAAEIGAEFDNPVLDTVLISAVLFGPGEAHTLDALAARLGVALPGAVRHTAAGDARATAGVFLRMIPMLEARGLVTFGDLLDAMARNTRLAREIAARSRP